MFDDLKLSSRGSTYFEEASIESILIVFVESLIREMTDNVNVYT